MARRRKSYKKSSKCPEPFNTLLDVAGAATLGLYVKHKVKKDFQNGCGEESAKAAAAVFGLGSMRRGSQGVINLGGLIGLNSALKDLDDHQISSHDTNQTVFISPIEKAPAISHPVKTGLWRNHCEDGTAYGVSPDDFDNADDYEDALLAAKGKKSTSQLSAIQNSPDNTVIQQNGNQYRWRKHCEDGSKYGIYPDDFESADDYDDALTAAKKENNGLRCVQCMT